MILRNELNDEKKVIISAENNELKFKTKNEK